MSKRIISSLLGYAFALAASILGLLLDLLFSPTAAIDPFLLFVPIVALTVWYGGVGPGLLSILFALFASDYFFIPPLYTFGLRIENLPHLGLFVIVAATVGLIAMINRRYGGAQESLTKLSSAIEQTGDIVMITDRAGKIEYVNPEFEKLTGYTAAEVKGRTPRVLNSGKQDSEFYAQLWKTILAGDVFRAEMVNRAKSGRLYHEEQTITPIKDRRGKITHFVSTGKDISDKVLARQLLEQQVRERTRDLETLYDLTALAVTSLDLKTVLNRSLDLVLEAMDTRIGSIRLVDENHHELYLAAVRGSPADLADSAHSTLLGEGLAGWILEHGDSLITTNLAEDVRLSKFNLESRLDAKYKAYAGVPLKVQGRVIGTLSVARPVERPFAPAEINLLASIADHLAISIEHARLFEQARERGVEKERARLAMELHDSATQSIYSMKLLADAAQRFSSSADTQNEKETLILLSETAQRALKEMRLLVYELRPPELEEVGLIGALQQRLDSVEKRAGVEASLVTKNVVIHSAPVAEALYRIAQEALNNSLQHAAATSVNVSLREAHGCIELQVEDNGKGFDQEGIFKQGGMGLITMRQRSERLGGELQIISKPGAGTLVKAKVNVQ